MQDKAKKEQRNKRKGDKSGKLQANMVQLLLDAEVIVREMSIRVDYLSHYGLKNVECIERMKEEGKIEYGIGEVTAERIQELIEYNGEVEWVEDGCCLYTRTRSVV